MFYHDYELGKSARVLTQDLFKLKPGETFIITADTETDPHVVDATARAAFSLDAKPMLVGLITIRYTHLWMKLLK